MVVRALTEARRNIAALKHVLIVALRIPWDLCGEEKDPLIGLGHDQIAELVVAELAGGPIQSAEARGVAAFLTKVLERSVDPIDRDAWASVLGQTRFKVTRATEDLRQAHRLNDALTASLKEAQDRVQTLTNLLDRCAPLVETAEGPGAGRLFAEIQDALGK